MNSKNKKMSLIDSRNILNNKPKIKKMRKLEITPGWILEKLPHTQYADGCGIVSVYSGDATDANWIEFALETLCISYESYDYLDENDDFVFGFDFAIEDIQLECPSFYKRMIRMNINNSKKSNIKIRRYENKEN